MKPPFLRVQPSTVRSLVASLACLGSLAVGGCATLGSPYRAPDPVLIPVASPQGEGHALFTLEGTVKADDAIVRVVSQVTCTGTLIAEDLVLTAHHCVAARDRKGRVLPRDQAPENISIEVGGDYLPWAEVRVRAVVSPDCGYERDDGDLAILVLSRRLIGMPTIAPRLDAHAKVGEIVSLTGFGHCASEGDPEAATRLRDGADFGPTLHAWEEGGDIDRVRRPGVAVDRVLPGQFEAKMRGCPGDSGGPALAEPTGPGRVDPRGELVGVLSTSVMRCDAQSCASYFTGLDGWGALFSTAREIADGASPAELPPFRSCEAAHGPAPVRR